MSAPQNSPQDSPSGVDVKLDEQGRIVVSPQLASLASTGETPDIQRRHGHVTNVCPNMVAGCGSPPV
ncbi:hypothetical protein ACIQI7_13220 [Kitasatospora sp. NPDC092039]|uniref:hypothetical protein n=1 Tax=Kitasatospora sp. NPDC092039 TaxID=3364086 RepID=UPI003800A884